MLENVLKKTSNGIKRLRKTFFKEMKIIFPVKLLPTDNKQPFSPRAEFVMIDETIETEQK